MWHSSWSGPRGYNNWHGTGLTSYSFIDYGWSTDCNDGGGTYTYYPVMQGYASGIGWGPKTRWTGWTSSRISTRVDTTR